MDSYDLFKQLTTNLAFNNNNNNKIGKFKVSKINK
jgi:hypothetical protein